VNAWDPERYGRHASFVPELGKGVVALLDPQPGERILDLGCGGGVLSLGIGALGAHVVGVDASEAQVKAARAGGVLAFVGRGETLAFARPFDAVFSNAALHWMKGADAVLERVAAALRSGGRFVAELGGRGNVASVHAALRAALSRRGLDPDAADPWYFPSGEEYRAKLLAHGFEVAQLDVFERPTPLPGDVRDWLLTFGQAFLAAVPAPQQEDLLAEVREVVRPRLRAADGSWAVDYVRLRFRALRR
jgi:SAM-dependent methyltransferase